MTRRKQTLWDRLRKWGLLFGTILAGAAVATLLYRWIVFGTDSANGWVDVRSERVAKKVVSDSLGYHRNNDRHRRR